MGRPLYGEKGIHGTHSGLGALRETPLRWHIAYVRFQRFFVRHSAQHRVCRCSSGRWVLSGLVWVSLESLAQAESEGFLSDALSAAGPQLSPLSFRRKRFVSRRDAACRVSTAYARPPDGRCLLPKYSDPRNLVRFPHLPHTRLTYHRTWETGLETEIRVAAFSPAFFCLQPDSP